jgi:hypothetical protein
VAGAIMSYNLETWKEIREYDLMILEEELSEENTRNRVNNMSDYDLSTWYSVVKNDLAIIEGELYKDKLSRTSFSHSQIDQIEELHDDIKNLADSIKKKCPIGIERARALRKLEEVFFWVKESKKKEN